MSDSPGLSASLAEIAQRCSEETERFFHRLPPDTRYCYELFRRALAQQDGEALALLIANYTPLVDSWVHRNSAFPMSGEDAAFFVAAAFEKMWQAISRERFHDFPDVKKLLHYLKLCAVSSIIDHLRLQAETESLDGDGRDGLSEPGASEPRFARVERLELWTEVIKRAQNDKELVVAFACLSQQMKPAEVFKEYAGVFESRREIYRVKQNLLERLRRDQELRKFLAAYA